MFKKAFRITNIHKATAALGLSLLPRKIHAAPTYQGVPVPGILLVNQSIEIFTKQFPTFEISSYFSPGQPFHAFSESVGFFGLFSNSCDVEIPVFERLSEEEITTLYLEIEKCKPQES